MKCINSIHVGKGGLYEKIPPGEGTYKGNYYRSLKRRLCLGSRLLADHFGGDADACLLKGQFTEVIKTHGGRGKKRSGFSSPN